MIVESFRNSGKYTVSEPWHVPRKHSSEYLRTYLASADDRGSDAREVAGKA